MKKMICLGTVSMIIAGLTVSQAFSDVSNTHWAKDAIDNMVEQKIISGYTDGTFQPSRNLSKIESIILLSKAAGVNKYNDATEKFTKEYDKLLSSYEKLTKSQKPFIAYLLGVNVLKEEDLSNLISTDKLNSPITREEMAVLITKILGKEEEVKNKSFVILPFDDVGEISAGAKPYVEYVYNEGIMKGLTKNKFSSKEYVTRAQVAIILNGIIAKIKIVPEEKQQIIDNTQANVTLKSGEITSIDTILKTIEIDEDDIYEYDDDTKIYLDDKLVKISDLKITMEITKAKIKDGVIEEIRVGTSSNQEDKNETKEDEYVVGEVIEATSKKVEIELEDGEKIVLYPMDEYKVIDAEDSEEMKLKKLDEGDQIIAVGEWDDEDYYFTVLIKLAL